MKKILIILLAICMMLVACEQEKEGKEKEVPDIVKQTEEKQKEESKENEEEELDEEGIENTTFDYTKKELIEVTLDDIQTHVDYMKEKPDAEVWESYFQTLQDYLPDVLRELEEKKFDKPLIQALSLTMETADLVDDMYAKIKNNEDYEDVERAIENKILDIEKALEKVRKLRTIEASEETVQELKEIYDSFLFYAMEQDYEPYADLFWNDDKEGIIQNVTHFMEGMKAEYRLHDFELIDLYEDAAIVKINQDNILYDIKEEDVFNQINMTVEIHFVKKDGEWKLYKDVVLETEELESV